MSEILRLINQFLICQISLNKGTYTIRGSGLDENNKIYKEQIAILAKEQITLQKELNRFLNEVSAEKISANMVDCLQKASNAMKKSGILLNEHK